MKFRKTKATVDSSGTMWYTCSRSKDLKAIKGQGGWLIPPKGGDSMSVFEAFMLVLTTATVMVALVNLMIRIADKFSKKGK